ncbi:hypothetical protein J2T11_003608 [Paenarthrobacter nicotinovorans]|uniref:hypothetical protein n=1 Tax=Paenarthrobacter nicotinovorans TaxID=29320 RepID=UPI00277FE60A|nr:hypothetical protein [Paenarthrobacter nicotinovorans]MDP9937237.1 hypothetical protein [Paenarthrobacter nicotinovorans]
MQNDAGITATGQIWRGRTGRAFLASLIGCEPHLFRFALQTDDTETPTLANQLQTAAQEWLKNCDQLPDLKIFEHASQFVNSYAHGLESEWRAFDSFLLEAELHLRAVARELEARAGLRWWAEPAALEAQIAFVPAGGLPEPGAALSYAISDREAVGTWWVSPAGFLVTTRGPVFGFTAVLDAAVDDHWRRTDEDSVWSIDVQGPVRVFEVHGAEDWAQFVRTYPSTPGDFTSFDWGSSQDGKLVLPDWRAVSQDWDGVHVSFAGYLGASYQPIALDRGHYTLLAGWHPDATVWLTGKARLAQQIP